MDNVNEIEMLPTVFLQERLNDFFSIWNFINIKVNWINAQMMNDHPPKNIFSKTSAKWLQSSFWFSYETDILNKLSTNHHLILKYSIEARL